MCGDDVEVSNLTCHEESEQYSCCGVVLDCESDDKIETYIENPLLSPHESVFDIKLDKRLDNSQKEELKDIIGSFSDVFRDVPGRTNKIEHDRTCCKETLYASICIASKVKKEIECMLEAGIAEKSNSPYTSSIVIVPKKMGPFDCKLITVFLMT